ncbi:17769_t:CDS:10 [Dentiscutata erythropus]|uniref:17769_t:CDS:1 n=1 Tax=Dentiscutata erythropus TaxID=1348616 RepID=A0A9N9IAM8_9GLOM|nr:17769_t:CDS:10 [Dentiscutata erythropus]
MADKRITVLQDYINAILTDSPHEKIRKRRRLQPGEDAPPRWNNFDLNQQRLVTELDAEYRIILASAKDDDQTIALLYKVADKVQDQLNEVLKYDPALIKHAFNVFINNHPAAIKLGLKTPSLKRISSVILLPGQSLPLGGLETKMVTSGVADPDFPNKNFAYTKDRQGELFIWMHKQMLARYDAERIAVGLDPVIPLDYHEPIPEGYLPNKHLLNFNENSTAADLQDKYDYRKPYSSINSPTNIANVDKWLQSINKSIDDGVFYNDPDKLGRTIDPDRTNPDILEDNEWKAKYGSLHAMGHIMVGGINGNEKVANALKEKKLRPPIGVILNVSIASKDPAFFRWHRLVDETFNRCIETTLKARTFTDGPDVVIKPDGMILAFKDQLEKVCPEGAHDGWQKFGQTHFAKIPATNELQTKMVPRNLRGPNNDIIKIEHVFPREFYYFFKVKNNTTKDAFDTAADKIVKEPAKKFVTLRVFIVPEVLAADRKQWIEMDKFKYELKAGEDAVIARSCELSSVIRKPAQKVFDDTPGDDFDNDYCGCGWPYHLLLPRGTRDGMKFKLYVYISDWNADKTYESTAEGSLSMCGRKIVDGRPAKYPDDRDMGYPFDRPYAGKSLQATFAKVVDPTIANARAIDELAISSVPGDYWLDNTAMRDFTIRWVDEFC